MDDLLDFLGFLGGLAILTLLLCGAPAVDNLLRSIL